MFKVKNKIMIRFFHEKEEPSKMCYSPSVWLGSSVS